MEDLEPCGILIKRVNDALIKNMNNKLRVNDLTFAQIQLLLILQKKESGICLKDLEKLLHIAQSTTVGIVKRLERKGLVEAYADSEDKRIKLIKITAAGNAVCRETQTDMDEDKQRILHSLTTSEIKQLQLLLQKVYKNFK